MMEEEEEVEREVEEVWSWGAGSDGQLGTGSFDDQHLPQLLSFPPRAAASSALRISQIACGGAHSIALTAGGSVLTWGRGTCGQLGHGDVENCLKPKPVEFFEQIIISYISAGWNHSGFVSDSGSLFTCGDGSFGQLGHGDYQSRSSPTKVLFFASKHVKKIACGMRHSLVLSKGPSGLGDLLYAFGSGRRGQLGTSLDSSRKSIAVPQAIHGFKDDEMIAVSANGDHSALLSANGHLYIWGRGFSGTSDSHLPQLLPSPLKFSQVTLGWNHALLLTDCGEVFMLGRMLGGRQESLEMQVPLCSTPSITPDEVCRAMIPTRVPGLDGVKVIDIGAGAEHSALVTENGTIMAWGWGEHGQLGLGDTCDHMIPQTVTMENGRLDASSWFRVYCGSGFTIAVGSTSLHSQS
ncbi:ultraviolet-B receptor UVR8 isoform X1 [Cinnamomum micranthum f. kanehirae]|uniref:Ultraviolet-B receptor UVR8 isoform X1 n=1 Tax=Cinnamomum micranthum f. kanehirae TaxID=337451 RepID=A0A3S3QSF5_9MAGN|nr:ultraviolet-B receptor UVR8 isoform X1 [Cinnamomum micranthum f. kanehirae]